MEISQAHSASDYLKFLDMAQKNLGPRPLLAKLHRFPKLPLELPGAINLLNSFSTGSPNIKVTALEEWNPFSQRPIYEVFPKVPRAFGSDFRFAAEPAHRLIILMHEAMHVLMWEPFFAGRMVPNSRSFTKLSLAFEGFCFWYGDFVVNGKIKICTPDGEQVFWRRSVSQPGVHPQTAFKKLRLKNPRDVMETYLSAFTGHETLFSRKYKDPLIFSLAERFYSFYKSSLESTQAMYSVFNSIGLFENFFKEFCRRPGIPTLMTEETLSLLLSGDTHQYCWTVYAKGMKHIEGLSPLHVERVRVRRAIQTRAYFAFSVQHLLANGWIVARPGFALEKVRSRNADYIQSLRAALIGLCQGDAVQSVKRRVKTADHNHQTQVRAKFSRHQVKSRRVIAMVPPMPGHSIIQIGEDRRGLSKKNLILFGQEILNRMVVAQLDFTKRSTRAKSLARLGKNLSLQILALSQCRGKDTRSKKLHSAISKTIDRILAHELVLQKWFVALDAVAPERNTFRETMILYQ